MAERVRYFLKFQIHIFKPILSLLSLLAPSGTARHPIFYCFHNTHLEMHLLEGPDQGRSTGQGKKEKIKKKKHHLAGFKPSRLQGVRSTAVLQSRPFKIKIIIPY